MRRVAWIFVLASCAGLGLGWRDRPAGLAGRGVYQSEGCVHCHSQYSRPLAADWERFGPPSSAPSGGVEPVLIGNRRQGPDLSNVGLRRSREWNRLHLIDPRSLSPGSRMPGYAHLFAEGDRRGESLLDYLDTLRTERPEEWMGQVSAWRIAPELTGDADRGALAFARSCSQCHGADGRGDGLAGSQLSRRPADLAGGAGVFVPEGLDPAVKREQRARIVKYGLPGTAMPGHEYLTDREIADLVSVLERFRSEGEAR